MTCNKQTNKKQRKKKKKENLIFRPTSETNEIDESY